METVTCALCGEQKSEAVCSGHDLLLGRGEPLFSLVSCSNCGLIYQNPRPMTTEMAAHYPPDYEGFVDFKNDPSLLLRLAWHYGLFKRKRIVSRFARSGRLLDVGCGTGHFLSAFDDLKQWRSYGVEVDAQAADYARQNTGAEVLTGRLSDADFPDEHFDAITLWDVLEHLHEPLDELQNLYRVLKPAGALILRVPNYDSRDARMFGECWSGFDLPRHLYVFSRDTLTRLLRRSQFQVVKVSSGIGDYPAFLLSVRFRLDAKKISRARRDLALKILAHPITRAVAAPLFFLRSIGARGSELVVVAVKSPPESSAARHQFPLR